MRENHLGTQNEISAWTQDFDFEVKDFGALERPELLQLLHRIDWTKLRREFFQDYADQCPPGFGVSVGERYFHLYVTDSDSWILHLRLPAVGKFLGFIPKPSKETFIQIENLGWAEKLLLLFLDEKDSEILATCSKHVAPGEDTPLIL